jgi:hypothetical protein
MLQIAEDDVQPLFQQMLLEHAVNGTSFAFYLSNKPGDGQSELTLGGYNPDKFKGDLQWHPLSSEDYWSIVFQGLKACSSDRGATGIDRGCRTHQFECLPQVGDAVITSTPAHAIVDSGTSLIAGPFFAVQRLLTHLRVAQDCSNRKQLPGMHAESVFLRCHSLCL